MNPTQEQIDAAHDAWEATVTEWGLRRVNSGMNGEAWLVERRIGGYDPGRDYANEIAYHKFDGKNAEQRARFFLRDKCIRAALAAALLK